MPKFKELVKIAKTKTTIIIKVYNNGKDYPIIESESVLTWKNTDYYLDEDIYDTPQGYAFHFSGYTEVFNDYNKRIKRTI